jgi:hypothetical protein
MKPFPLATARQCRRGSALVTVIIFSFVLLTLAASVMQWSLTERRLNSRNAYWLEARNAAEAAAEYGCYQVAQAFNNNMNPTFGTGGTVTISLPSTSFFAGSHVDPGSISLRVGNIQQVPNATSLYYVDPLDPNNTFDPLISRYVYRRDVKVVSKATVNPRPGGGRPVTAYVEEKVSVRGAPLFAYAIFYSGNDLEFGETPTMDIYGPVHVNGNLFVGPAGSSPQTLTFHGQVTASGNVYHAWRGTTTTAQEGGSTMSATTPVKFSTDSTIGGNPVDMRVASTGVWNDSTMGADSSTSGLAALTALLTDGRKQAFKDYASKTWNGNLETAAMGITSYNLMGSTEAVAHNSTTNTDILATDGAADDAATVGTTALGTGYGHGYGPHSLIEPSMAPAASTDPYKGAKAAIEQSKFANKAGLYIKVQVAADNSLTGITLYGDPNSAPSGTPAANIGPNGGIKLGSYPANVIQYIPYTTTTSGGNTYVQKGMYDHHQDKGINLVQIDMQKLKTALTDMAGTTTTAGTDIVAANGTTKWGLGTANTFGYDQNVATSTGWNGGVYIEVANASTNQTALLFANGQIASGSSLVPNGTSAPNGVTGLTVATNAPAYILGNFNADGTIAGTSATNNSALYPDDVPASTTAANLPAAVIASKEAPVAIAADAVTVLSGNYFGTDSTTNLAPASAMTSGSAYNSYKTPAPNASGSVEIAAAIISGTIPTSPDSTGTQAYSGGVHNFPRFLETWGSNTVAIRGAMVCMYNSRIATAGWSQSYYSAPFRQWGFDQVFANGKFPPICPQVLQYRRVDFTYLKNATVYATELSTL